MADFLKNGMHFRAQKVRKKDFFDGPAFYGEKSIFWNSLIISLTHPKKPGRFWPFFQKWFFSVFCLINLTYGLFWGPSMTLGWVISHAFGQKYGEKAIFRKKFFIFCKTYPKKLGRFWNFGIFHSTFSKCHKMTNIIAGIDSLPPNEGSLRPRFLIFSDFPHFFDKNFKKFQNLPQKLG